MNYHYFSSEFSLLSRLYSVYWNEKKIEGLYYNIQYYVIIVKTLRYILKTVFILQNNKRAHGYVLRPWPFLLFFV